MDDIVVEKVETPDTSKSVDVRVSDKPFAPLFGLFDLTGDSVSNTQSDQLNMVWEFLGKQVKDDTIAGRLMAVRELEMSMGALKVGESRLTRLHNYVKARKSLEDAQWQVKQFIPNSTPQSPSHS